MIQVDHDDELTIFLRTCDPTKPIALTRRESEWGVNYSLRQDGAEVDIEHRKDLSGEEEAPTRPASSIDPDIELMRIKLGAADDGETIARRLSFTAPTEAK